jgi:ADP-ribose pyrophosphatase YjhB (NUDIX family)
MGRDYPAHPLVGVGAIILDANRVVLVRRGRPPALGHWSLPGGLVELGETMEEAIVREVEEEVGLKVEVSQLVSVLDWILLDAAGNVEFHYVLMDFLCRPTGGALGAGSDVLSACLVPLEAIPQYLLKRETMEVIDHASRCCTGHAACLYLRRRATTTEP